MSCNAGNTLAPANSQTIATRNKPHPALLTGFSHGIESNMDFITY